MSNDLAGAGPMSDIRIVDLSMRIAGDYCTKLLADMGAEVIKVEPPDSDASRRARGAQDGVSDARAKAAFLFLNTNKQSITLDVTTVAGRGILAELASQSAAVVETYTLADRSRLGLDGRLPWSSANESLVHLSITDFGLSGPYADYKGTSIIDLGLGCWSNLMGDEDGPPLQPGVPLGEYVGGLFGAAGLLGALHYAEATGLGQDIEIAIVEAIVAVNNYDMVAFSYSGALPHRTGHRYRNSPMTAVMTCRDGFVQYQNSAPNKWPAMLDMIGRPELKQDERFRTPAAQAEHIDELEAIFRDWFAQHTRREIWDLALQHRLVFSTVPDLADILASPQHAAREWFVRAEDSQADWLCYPGPPFRLGSTPWSLRRRAPEPGVDNARIYSQLLGYSREKINLFRQQGVI